VSWISSDSALTRLIYELGSGGTCNKIIVVLCCDDCIVVIVLEVVSLFHGNVHVETKQVHLPTFAVATLVRFA
jgi:hypothetical protein